jgi:threonine dehydrogenase-like Zn-dependent dehydrogenase
VPPEASVRVRVASRASAASEGDAAAWSAFAGEVVSSEAPGGVPVGARVAGFGPQGDEVRVPAWAVAVVPEGMAPEMAATLPLAAVAARAARLVGAGAGESACVIGSGRLPDLVAAALRAAGARDVSVVTAPGEAVPPLVVDTTGDPAVIRALLEGAPRLGRSALAGASHGRTTDVDFYRTVHHRGLEVVGVHEFGPLSDVSTPADRTRDLEAAGRLLGQMSGGA